MKRLFLNIKYGSAAFLMVLGVSNAVKAQEQVITLEAAKEAALEYSNDIKNGKLRIEQADAAKSQALTNYLPTVQAMGVGLYAFNDFVAPIPGILPDGINNIYLATATATELVYAGGKVRAGSELATIQVEANKIKARQSVDSVLLLTEQKYWQLVQIQEQQKVLKVSEVYLNELLKQQSDLLSAGLIAENQLLQVRVNRSKLLLQQSKLNNVRKLALLDFALYTGISYDTGAVVVDTLGAVKSPVLSYQSPELDLNRNSNYQLLEKAIKASQLQTKMAKADMMPQVAVGLSAAKFGVVGQDLDSDVQTIGFGTVSIPISNWWGSNKYKIRQREIHEHIVANNFKDVQDKLTVGIMKAWYDLIDAYHQVEFAQENLDYAKENLKVQRDNYSSGLNNITDLLDAQRIEQEAKTELVNAFANYETKEVAYLYRTDQLSQPLEIEE